MSSEDAMSLHEEKENLRRELICVLRNDVSSVFMQLGLLVKDCCRQLSTHVKPQISSKLMRNVPTLPLNHDRIRGYICLDKTLISKADIQIFFSRKSKRPPLRLSILQSKPWSVIQMQHASNYLALALTEINNAALQHGTHRTRAQIVCALSRILRNLGNALSYLSVPHPLLVSLSGNGAKAPTANNTTLTSVDALAQTLHPSLPPDIAMDIYLRHGSLIIAVNMLSLLEQGAKIGTTNGSVSLYRGRLVEIINKTEIECPVPWILELLAMVTSAQELCQRLQTKLNAFTHDDLEFI